LNFIFVVISAVEPTSYCKVLHSSVGFIPNKFCNFLPFERRESDTADTPQRFLWLGGDCTQWVGDVSHTKNYCSAYGTPKWKLKWGICFVQPVITKRNFFYCYVFNQEAQYIY